MTTMGNFKHCYNDIMKKKYLILAKKKRQIECDWPKWPMKDRFAETEI